MEQTYFDMFLQGGFIIYILLILSIISLAIIVERLVYIYKRNIRYNVFFSELKSVCNSNDEKTKNNLLQTNKISFTKYIAKLKPNTSSTPSHNKQIIEYAKDEEDLSFKKRMHVLIFIVQLAPLLGILGTVLGLAESFLSIGNLGGTEKFQLLSQGIGKALSTTIAGLVIAAYTMSGHYFIKYRSGKSIANFTQHIDDFVQIISEKDDD